MKRIYGLVVLSVALLLVDQPLRAQSVPEYVSALVHAVQRWTTHLFTGEQPDAAVAEGSADLAEADDEDDDRDDAPSVPQSSSIVAVAADEESDEQDSDTSSDESDEDDQYADEYDDEYDDDDYEDDYVEWADTDDVEYRKRSIVADERGRVTAHHMVFA